MSEKYNCSPFFHSYFAIQNCEIKNERTAFVMPKHCEYVQQIKHLKKSMEEIEKTLNEHAVVKQWAYIVHDKDKNDDGTPKEEHIHLYLNFGRASVQFENVANWFDDKPQYINNVKGRKKDILKYLTHQNAPDKYQYDIKNIKSNFNIGEAIMDDEKTDINAILRKIADGTIREYNRFEHIDEVVLAKNNSLIKAAFKNRSEKIMRDPNRDMKVIFIYGTTGSGKTTYAKMLASKMGDGSFYVSSSANDSMQDYAGQETVIFDDLRDTAFDFSDLLKVLDNHTATSIKSRFYNKTFLGNTMIITTTVPILDWYKFSNEDKAQLRRRITNYLIMDEDEISFYNFDPDNNYLPTPLYTIKNPVAELIAQKAKEKQKKDNLLDICKSVLYDMDESERKKFTDEIDEIEKM